MGSSKLTAFLIDRGLSPIEGDSNECMPHQSAARHGHLHLLRWFVRSFATLNVDEESVPGRFTALHYAASNGHLALVESLLEAGADLDRKCTWAEGLALTATELAALKNHAGIVDCLRDHKESQQAAARVEHEVKRRSIKTKGGKLQRRASNKCIDRPPPLCEYLQARVPPALVCPISLEVLRDPVLLVADGCTYLRAAIERHFAVRRGGSVDFMCVG